MLRRKLILLLTPLVGMLLLTAVVAVYLLQGVLTDLDHVSSHAWRVVEEVNQLSTKINLVEVDLYELQTGRERHLDKLIEDVAQVHQTVDRLKSYDACQQADAEPMCRAIREQLPIFEKHVAALATTQDRDLALEHNRRALAAAVTLREQTLPLSRLVNAHAQAEQESLSHFMRWLVLGLAVVFLAVINISVMVLLRMSGMVLRPLDALIEATKQLGQERFDYRVELKTKDEFGQLGEAYNRMALQLQLSEQRKIETLQQLALTMNHELNNALAIIDLQLQLMGRQAHGNPAFEKNLREIHDSLQRVTRTVQSLKQIRRIVLTDYVGGVKMLDLERSIMEERADEPLVARTGPP